ncbi:MAG: PEP-CTERM sorting domain-containing protein [Chthonomonas sp.]|nr:PEP-CTERM sorting domain-containing protein [Chthonomonas sp.]
MKTYKIALPVLAIAGAAVSANALVFDTGYEYTGGTNPAGTPPWNRVTITDVVPGTVTIKLANINLVGTEFVSEASINFNPLKNVTSLTFGSPVSVGTFDLPSISKSANAYKAGGGGYYDIKFDFATANSKRFGVGESLTYTVSGIAGLMASDFNFVSINAPTGVANAATAWHVQSIGPNGSQSGWVAPVPEPSAIFAVALGSLVVLRRKRK